MEQNILLIFLMYDRSKLKRKMIGLMKLFYHGKIMLFPYLLEKNIKVEALKKYINGNVYLVEIFFSKNQVKIGILYRKYQVNTCQDV